MCLDWANVRYGQALLGNDVQLISLEKDESVGQGVSKLVWTSLKNPDRPKMAAWFDEGKGWIIRKCEIFVPSMLPYFIRIAYEYDYSVGPDGQPVLSKAAFSHTYDKRQAIGVSTSKTWTFEDVSFEPTPEAEFSLTHYGLPEIRLTQPGLPLRRDNWLWLSGIGVGFVAFTTFLLRVKRRRGDLATSSVRTSNASDG